MHVSDPNGQILVQFNHVRQKTSTSIDAVQGGNNLQTGDIRLVKWIEDGQYYNAKLLNIGKFVICLMGDGSLRNSNVIQYILTLYNIWYIII